MFHALPSTTGIVNDFIKHLFPMLTNPIAWVCFCHGVVRVLSREFDKLMKIGQMTPLMNPAQCKSVEKNARLTKILSSRGICTVE